MKGGGGGIIWSPVMAKRIARIVKWVGFISVTDRPFVFPSCSANSSQEKSQTKQYVWATIDISYLIIKKYIFLIFTMESIILAYINWLIVISRLTSVLEIKQTKSLKFQQNEVKQKRRVVYCWSGGSSKSLHNLYILKTTFNL